MTTKLQEIVNYKKEELLFKKSQVSNFELNSLIEKQDKPRGFVKSLKNSKKLNLIAEIKKASPSKGIIRSDFNPIFLAKCYQNGDASCLSVLTDKKFFQGDDSYINLIKNNVDLPILRKDFIVDMWQIKESRSLGADCILLMMSILTLDEAILFEKEAFDLGMDVLVETHTYEEILMANKLSSNLIGINNRNLKNMKVDINNTLKLKKFVKPNKIIVAESGLKTYSDLKYLSKNGINNFLIGESLMKENDLTLATRRILGSKH